jgi:phosphate transport system permease protein
MTVTPTEPPARPAPAHVFPIIKRRTRFLGLTLEECIKAFFGGNATVAVIVLTLITVFLVREGIGFFEQNRQSLEVYRRAGLEYVDYVRAQEARHTELGRELMSVRIIAMEHYIDQRGLELAEANAQLEAFDDWSYAFSDTIEPVRAVLADWTEIASELKTRYTIAQDRMEERRQLLAVGRGDDAAAVQIEEIDFSNELQQLKQAKSDYEAANAEVASQLRAVLRQEAPQMPTPALQARLEAIKGQAERFIETFPRIEQRLADWDYNQPVTMWESIASFFTGRQWLTASFWQDHYGVIPLFTGSLMVSLIALSLAVPLGVGGAIYINQIASLREQRLIKPSIEFISAIPSVVLGFFGIVVLGEALRVLSQQPWMAWFPGFPIAERLNALTAGILLALIAVPTIFTLAEDALQNVPRAFKEASYALGATRLQTTFRIIVPASLSGIISAVLLGFGRVIGETMVVLLVAGNRIAIPDFTAGLGVVTQPVHTMTGIIAQEMGEVVQGSIHYRALFVVGLFLFVLALGINYAAQKIVQRYRISVG